MKSNQEWIKVFQQKRTPLQLLNNYKGVTISVKRDDLNHALVQGNKLRKLKYNLMHALENGYDCVATFGGAWSNHILATANAADLCGIKCIGVIRGEELENQPGKWSETLNKSAQAGMELHFLNRQQYRLKHNSKVVQSVISSYPRNVFLIPEGGSNRLAVLGVAEIISELQQQTQSPTHIISACGTGGTLAGLIEGVAAQAWDTQVWGIPVLKRADFLYQDIKKLSPHQEKVKWQLFGNYHAGGYAKMDDNTMSFAKKFIQDNSIDLDKIYTAKAFFATYDLIDKGMIPAGSKVIVLHTGGLQDGLNSVSASP
jgi:1-aminocyclopropane-1-carboxylate deaminase